MILLFACAPAATPPEGSTPETSEPLAPTEGTDVPDLIAAEDLDPASGSVRYTLSAGRLTRRVGDTDVDGYAYDGVVPGPVLRARLGDLVTVEVTNALDEPTTVHWHGLHVPWSMDGASWIADPIPPGGRFVYTFEATNAGTFWYHPHFDTEQQVDLGLYGMFVVEDPADPEVPAFELVLDDVGAVGHDAGDGWTVNGAPAGGTVRASVGPLRVRIVNTSNAGYAALRGALRLLGTDQGLGGGLELRDEVVLAPGDRAELEVVGPATWELAPYTSDGGPAWGEASPLVVFDLPPAEPATWPFAGLTPDDPGGADLTYTLQGDGDAWLINGEQWPDVTVERLPLGAEALVEVRNLSAAHHPFHLHGHAFDVISIDGVPPTVPRREDTLDVPIRSVARLRLVADNPGRWMLHCHILPHAHDGMMTVLDVTEPP